MAAHVVKADIKPASQAGLSQGAIQVLRNAIFLEIGPPPTPS